MNTTPLKDLLDTMESLRAAIEREKLDLLAAETEYDQRGARLEGLVVAVLKPYWDERNNRAPEIRDAAEVAAAEVRRFTGRRANVLSIVGLVLLRLDQAALGYTIDALEWPPALPNSSDPLQTVLDFIGKLDEAQLRLVIAVGRIILAERMVLFAATAAPSLIRLRQARLETFIGETLTVDVDAALESIEKIVEAEIRAKVIETLVEAAAAALNIAVETVFPVTKVATLLAELYVDLKSIQPPHAREHADDIFDFRRQIAAENQAVDKAVVALQSVFEALAN